MSAGDWFGTALTIVVAALMGWMIFVWGPEREAEEKREIQCETLGGTYYEGRCIEISGTIELPEKEA